jgi:hypothetical protein
MQLIVAGFLFWCIIIVDFMCLYLYEQFFTNNCGVYKSQYNQILKTNEYFQNININVTYYLLKFKNLC